MSHLEALGRRSSQKRQANQIGPIRKGSRDKVIFQVPVRIDEHLCCSERKQTYSQVSAGSCRSGSVPVKLFDGILSSITFALVESQTTPYHLVKAGVQGSMARSS